MSKSSEEEILSEDSYSEDSDSENGNKKKSKKKPVKVVKGKKEVKNQKETKEKTSKAVSTKPSEKNSIKGNPQKPVNQSSSKLEINSVIDSALNSLQGDITRGSAVTTDAAAKKLVQQYLTLQNRPYSAIQIHDNLHKRVPKATLERVLTQMSTPGSGHNLMCKEYGKAKIYFVDQSTLPSNYTAEELDEIQSQNEILKSNVEQLKPEERSLQMQLKDLKDEPTDENLLKMIEELEQRIEVKSKKLHQIKQSNQDPDALKQAIHGHNFFRNLWLKRKQVCQETLDMLSDGMNKKPSLIMTELCMESDADVQMQVPSAISDLFLNK